MRWLLLKDLQILRRSPLQAALLVAYPVLIAVLVGFAISRSPDKPRIAFLNNVPTDTSVSIGGDSLDIVNARNKLCDRIDCVRVRSRREAVDAVQSGDVLGALILPSDLAEKVNSLASLNPSQPVVDVIVNREDPVQARIVDDRISALLSEANLLIARRVAHIGSSYLDLILKGGNVGFLGQGFDVLGLRSSAKILSALRPSVAPAFRPSLDAVVRFARLARDNLDLAGPLLTAVAEPIGVRKESINGSSPPLDVFAIAVTATVTLMFVTVLLVAGSLALEREENAFTRLTRGLVSGEALLAEKVLLGMAVSLVVTLLLLGGLEIFVSLQWSRIGLMLLAILAGGAGFAAAGAALGALAREVRAASLLAFMIALPVAFLSLVPAAAVGATLNSVIDVVAALFPFRPALDAMTTALDASGPSLGTALGHLAALVVGYSLLARLALRRLA